MFPFVKRLAACAECFVHVYSNAGLPNAMGGYDDTPADMAKYNEDLVKAGVLLDGNGLQPSSKGARVRFSGDKRTVIDGPFAEAKELVAGYWIFQVKSKEEAVQWAKKIPADDGQMVELRRVFEMSDFYIDPAGPIHDQVGRVEAGLKANQGKA